MMRGDGGSDDAADGEGTEANGEGTEMNAERPDDQFERAKPIDAVDAEPRADDGSGASGDDPATAEDAPVASGDGRLRIPLETIAVLNWLGEVGVDGVEARLDRVHADDLTVETEQVKIGYAGPETILGQFVAEDRAGARVPVEHPFTGTVLVLFPVKSAHRAASLMLQRAVEDAESVVSTEMGRDALTELCNMMANGFVDEWAAVFDASIDTGAPVAVQNPEMTLVHHIFSVSDVGLYLSARFRIVERDVETTVLVFPGEAEFVADISKVRPETIDR